MSEKNVYIAHFWERPALSTTGDIFQSDVIDAMKYGTPQMPSLRDLYVPRAFTANSNPLVFIITPWDSSLGEPNFPYVTAIQMIRNFMETDLNIPNELIRPVGYYPTLAPGADAEQGAIAEDQRNPYGNILFQYDPEESRYLTYLSA